MTLQEAYDNIGAAVVYKLFADARHFEAGVITSVNDSYVFVRYGDDTGSKATYASDLTLSSRL